MLSIKKQFKSVMLGLLVLLMIPLPAMAEEEEDYFEITEYQLRMLEVYDLLETLHVSLPSEEQLSETSIQGMIDSLADPYTQYLSPSEWEAFRRSLDQSFTGIGVSCQEDSKGIRIVEVFPGSPAEEAGLQSGDYLVAVNGTFAEDRSLDDFLSLIPEKEDAAVSLTLRREGKVFQADLTVRTVVIPSVMGNVLSDGTGYIAISMFASEAGKEFKDVLAKLQGSGIHSLIVDLRDNPGGLSDAAQQIGHSFMEEGILMHMVDSSGNSETLDITGGSELSLPVAVLINENSASAAEVLAGSLQDYEKAQLIGTQSFGKGTVQSMYELSGGGVLKISAEEYLTPNGHPVNGIGITPDLEVEGSLPQLLFALHAVHSVPELTVRGSGQAEINGVRFAGDVPLLRRDSGTYVHSRVLAALVGSTIEWNGDLQAVQLSVDGRQIQFTVGTDAIMEEDQTYLELETFRQAFPGFTWQDNEDGLTLGVQP